MRRICVYCGSSKGSLPEFEAAAKKVGDEIAHRGWGLVYGGGAIGLMGTVADAALAAGGEVIGVIPRALDIREVAHKGLTKLHVVETMHERKALMAELADGFAALPGGIGTFEELFETLTWSQLGIHNKPIAVLNVGHYYDPLDQMMDHAEQFRFLGAQHRSLLSIHTDVGEMLDALTVSHVPTGHKWLDLEHS